jgi:hypothetical protein
VKEFLSEMVNRTEVQEAVRDRILVAGKANGGQSRRGRSKTRGRGKGVPNKATRAWRDFVAGLLDAPFAGLTDAIKAHSELVFKAAGHAFGKPGRR